MARRDTCCFKCTHFHLQSTPGEDGKPEDAFGLCRRHAPEVMLVAGKYDTDLEPSVPISYWPEVSGIDWCGEFG